MNTFDMDAASVQRKLGKSLWYFSAISLALLALAFLFGGFSDQKDPSNLQTFTKWGFTLYIAIVPIIFIGFLLLIEQLRIRADKNIAANLNKLSYTDPFALPSQEMHGYKVTFLTGRTPIFTGLTGDRYTADAMAQCALNPQHIPPVANCECGFYAYKDLKSAQHELSINPGAFLIDVDLFGVGFTYTRGFKAESQVVNFVNLPKRCMRCKIFTPTTFVATYKLGYNSSAYWRWEYRCGMCSFNFKEEDCLTPEQMSRALQTPLR